jgi:acyl-coenzyme A thioesterase PaaI-like protein
MDGSDDEKSAPPGEQLMGAGGNAHEGAGASEDAEREALCESARRVMEHVRLTRANSKEMAEVRECLARAEEMLSPTRHAGALSQSAIDGSLGQMGQTRDPMALFPYSPVIGRLNPLAPPMRLETRGEEVHGSVVFSSAYCGPPNHTHGGVVAATFDELLGIVNVVNGVGAMTGTLTVTYHRPTPLFEEIRVEARTQRVEGRKVYTEGQMWHGETLLAEAEGVFILIGEETVATLNLDLA